MKCECGECRTCYIREYTREYRKQPARAAKHRATSARYRRENPESAKRSQRNSYATRREFYKALTWAGRYEPDQDALDYREVLLRDPCSYCGGAMGSIDHIVPESAGGPTTWDNLTAACRRCNSSKGVRPLLLFLAHRNGCYQWRCDAAAA